MVYILITIGPVCEHIVRDKEKKEKGKKNNGTTIGPDPIRMSIIIIKLNLKKIRPLEHYLEW